MKDLFTTYNENTYFNYLKEKTREKTYYEKNKTWTKFLEVLSYLCSIASLLSGAVGLYWIIEKITNNPYLAFFGALIFLVVFEIIIRKSSKEFWEVFYFKNKLAFGWLLVSIFCFIGGGLLSTFGGKKGGTMAAPPPALVQSDSLLTAYNAKIDSLNKKDYELSLDTNSQGIVFGPTQKKRDQIEIVISQYEKRKLALDEKLEGKKELLSAKYQNDVELASWVVAFIIALFAILFELCMWRIQYFHFRNAIDSGYLTASGKQKPETATGPQPPKKKKLKPKKDGNSNSNSNNIRSLTIKEIEDFEAEIQRRIEAENNDEKKKELKQEKRQVQAYKYKLQKDVGKPETACKNILEIMKRVNYKSPEAPLIILNATA